MCMLFRLTVNDEAGCSTDAENGTRARRLQLDRERKCTARQSETDEERARRLQLDRERKRTARQSDTNEEQARRLQLDRERKRTARQSETDEEQARRLQLQRERNRTARQSETEEERLIRLAANQVRISSNRNTFFNRAGFNYDPTVDLQSDILKLGSMCHDCKFCGALKWKEESQGVCCNNGKVKLILISEPPEILKNLLKGDTPADIEFQKNLIRYNDSFKMTSFGADKNLTDFSFTTTYKVQGQVYHLLGSLLPPLQGTPKYAQVYFIGDTNEESSQRHKNSGGILNMETLNKIQLILHQHHQYVKSFKKSIDYLSQHDDKKIVIHADKVPQGQHKGRYNSPLGADIGVILSNEEAGARDIIIANSHDNSLKRIKSTHPWYDALQYPLIFWDGKSGYHFGITKSCPNTDQNSQKTVSSREFYSYHFMVRENHDHLFHFKSLLSQFATDMYAKIESERLSYIRHNQSLLRADSYIHLRDAISSDVQPSEIGQRVILPSSFTGGPRYMHEKTQEAMAIVRRFGKPDLFITMTCNPKWPDISNVLIGNQYAHERHDIVARVFHLKMKKLLWLLKEGELFGKLKGYVSTIEWQKRGLPHSHNLIWCAEKIRPDLIDSVVVAEIPDLDIDQTLHHTIISQMVHGPCGRLNPNAPCMKNGQCMKGFPKAFQTETVSDCDGYPMYRRRSPSEGGSTVHRRVQGKNIEITNQWIVPYNPTLCKIFDAHINVEICSSIKSIIYVTKYINKGCDMATFSVDDADEISKYLSGRYISSNEAFWRIFNFDIHQRYPIVVNMPVHLENGQRVYFNNQNAHSKAQLAPKTMLTSFFDLCSVDDFARKLFYNDVPTYYTWSENKRWQRRKRGAIDSVHGVLSTDAIGRVYTVHPKNRECFYLRLLLHSVRGPLSFNDLRTVDGVLHDTYQSACLALGLLESDEHWRYALLEATTCCTPPQLRKLFVLLLTACDVSNPLGLWEEFRSEMLPDIRHTHQNLHDEDALYNILLHNLQHLMSSNGCTLESYGLPSPSATTVLTPDTTFNMHQVLHSSLDRKQCESLLTQNLPLLNAEQRTAFDFILGSIERGEGRLIFLDAPGGTGKTFLLNILLSTVLIQDGSPIAVCSSGIAATLLNGATTAHGMFQIPLDIERFDRPSCSITKNSQKGKLLSSTKLIVWDEACMTNKKCFETVDNTLRDIRNCDKPMGGITTVLSGDFRQILPVIPRGTRADHINACLKSSYLWPYIDVLQLTNNMLTQTSCHSLHLFYQLGTVLWYPAHLMSLTFHLVTMSTTLVNL